jgi:WD40 repeat protein
MQAPELDRIISGSFSRDGSRLLTVLHHFSAPPYRVAQLWDAQTGQRLVDLGGVDGVWNGGLSADGAWLVVCRPDGSAELWDARSGRKAAALAPAGAFSDAEFPSLSKRLLVVDSDDRASLWSLDPVEKLADLGGPGGAWTHDLAPDSETLITRSEEGTANLWDLATGRRLPALSASGPVSGTAYAPDGALLIVVQEMGATILDVRSQREVGEIAGNFELVTVMSRQSVVLKGRGGEYFLASLGPQRTLVSLGRLDAGEEGAQFVNHDQWLLVRDESGGVRLHSGVDGRLIADLVGAGGARSIEFSEDGTRLLAQYDDRQAALIDASLLASEAPERGRLVAQACTANGDSIAPFLPADRDNPAFRSGLRGRPWRVCDWRGLRSVEGWLQAIRYWSVRAGLPWDYGCHERDALGGPRSSVDDQCRAR